MSPTRLFAAGCLSIEIIESNWKVSFPVIPLTIPSIFDYIQLIEIQIKYRSEEFYFYFIFEISTEKVFIQLKSRFHLLLFGSFLWA